MGLSCDAGSGLCVESGCEGKTCASGEACAQGACVDACKDARCPHGATCKAGQCADALGMFPVTTDAGSQSQAGAAAASTDAPRAGAAGSPSGTSGLPTTANAAGSRSDTTAAANSGGARAQLRSTDGCGCRIMAADETTSHSTSAWFGSLGFAYFMIARRVRRSSRKPHRAASGCIA
jgi:hypothetical protein